ncbi:hypothetical protein CEP51_002411 [Fusarium floridanum]|uniref:Uncharacterized protein n=1 Tax=Fusarium floridanum TaxID=1325733 RepID=A0A428SBF8_9HYPO|nr:hypothetical protein CEP51_002411 [Fusarium floridanum]
MYQPNNLYGQPPVNYGYPQPTQFPEKPGIPNDPALPPVTVSTQEQYPPRTTPPDKKLSRSRCGFVTAGFFFLALYATVMSGLWLATAIVQPRWGDVISAKKGRLSPSNAALISQLLSKTIEISFATVFIGYLGQVLSRRAMASNTKGITLADMTMKRWVVQPGSVLTHIGAVSLAGFTFLGVMTFAVLIATFLYTTASEALVSPKLKYSPWKDANLKATVHTWYGNPVYAARQCQPLLKQNLGSDIDLWDQAEVYFAFFNCLILQFSSQSSHDLYSYLTDWNNTDTTGLEFVDRPAGSTMVDNNVTMQASWVDAKYKDVPELYKKWGRIVDNATIALPHPRVWEAFRSPANGILQPEDLGGLGGINMKARVSSPTLNALCVNMDGNELQPIVTESWPGDDKNASERMQERRAEPGSTVVDEIFGWADEGGRGRPQFDKYPETYGLLFPEASGTDGTAQYILIKAPNFANYTLCQLRTWLSANCSTHLSVGGTQQQALEAHCLDTAEKEERIDESIGFGVMGGILADALKLFNVDTLGLSSNPNLLTRLALKTPELPTDLPSMAEAFCVFTLASLSSSALGTTFQHKWDYGAYDPRANKDAFYDYNRVEVFHASISSQQYTSGHIDDWQKAFYAVLAFVFVTNLMCLLYFVFHFGLVADFTEPENHFALAINSPPTEKMVGSAVDGPHRSHMAVHWRISAISNSSGYCFEPVSPELAGNTQTSGVYQRVSPQE